ncbi:MAG TPA: OmpA family protein [Candidatus Kapabacteria bacterium]|nr:OmpA family protein [Candidatus Kapabacteria bacterium]
MKTGTNTTAIATMASAIPSLLLLLCLMPAGVSAQGADSTEQNTGRLRAGITGAAALDMHRGEFSAYDGIQECGVFDNATTLGWQAGYVLDIPLARALGISTRLYYWKADGDFTASNPYTVRVAVDDRTTVPLLTEHTLETSLDYVMLDPLLRWNIAGGLYVAAGPSVGLPARAAFQQTERIVSPQGITFENGEQSRKILAGNFDELGTISTKRSVRIAATAALGVEMHLSNRFTLAPEASYNYGFTSVLSSFSWKVSALRAGASLLYTFGDEGRRDTIAPPAAAPQPVMAFDVQNQNADGSREKFAEIVLNQEQASDVIPLLPYLFFAPNSGDLPARYARLAPAETSNFSESTLRDSVLGVYHHLLDIVGSRMRAYPEAAITVTGCREPLDDAGSTTELSTARATAAKSYLVSTWGIAPDRIRIAAQTLPGIVSNRAAADGREENRRAEIASSDPRILAPVTRHIEARSHQPAAIAVVPAVQFGESIAAWKLTLATADGRAIWERSGSGAPPADLLWNVNDGAIPSAPAHTTITATLDGTTATGAALHAVRAIPVRTVVSSRRYNGEIVRDSLVERYNMIFFDFDTPRISDFNQQVVGLIQSRMRTSSSVSITGLTDRVGDAAHNETLSRERAESAAVQIRSRIVPERVRAEGAGERLIYDNDLPEGRLYNRTVIIEIATPQE